MKKILVISGSPQKGGNTSALIDWLHAGAGAVAYEVVLAAFLRYKFPGCTSCRRCQKREQYGCVIDDEGSTVLLKMVEADVIVMATPLYFFGPSAQMKCIMDRMFSLYKWDNVAGTMTTVLKGKTLALLASAFEDIGLDALEAPFRLTADYSGMTFHSLIIPNAGVSGEIKNKPDVREKTMAFGAMLAQETGPAQ